MVQSTETERATDELLLAGTLSSEEFTAALLAYSVLLSTSTDTPALMLLEENPHRIVPQDERQNLVRFAFFNPNSDFTPYTSGRIFHMLGELRWELQHSGVYIVYTGRKEYKPSLQDARETELDAYIPRDREYFLFGKRLDKEQIDRIGSTAHLGDFAEVRIPRLLRYPQLPALGDAEQLQLVTREYVDPATALNCAFRFKNLVPYQKQPAIIGANKA